MQRSIVRIGTGIASLLLLAAVAYAAEEEVSLESAPKPNTAVIGTATPDGIIAAKEEEGSEDEEAGAGEEEEGAEDEEVGTAEEEEDAEDEEAGAGAEEEDSEDEDTGADEEDEDTDADE